MNYQTTETAVPEMKSIKDLVKEAILEVSGEMSGSIFSNRYEPTKTEKIGHYLHLLFEARKVGHNVHKEIDDALQIIREEIGI